jgi:hypothetical protein
MESMTPPQTLPALLWGTLGALESAYAAQGAAAPGMPSLDFWANLLRAIGEKGSDLGEMPAIICLSRRAVRTRIATAVRRGWVEQLKLGRGRTSVCLTNRGSEVAARWKLLQKTAEEGWQATIGVDQISRLRAALERLVAAFPLEHPHYPAGYGSADASITGRGGQDWKAVPRGVGGSVSDCPLSALVAQALVAFAIDYEEISPVALSLSTAVIMRVPSKGIPLKMLGDSIGVSALCRHGFLLVSGAGASQTACLTSKGLAVKYAYEGRIEAVETEWQDRFGRSPVAELRHALERVVK